MTYQLHVIAVLNLGLVACGGRSTLESATSTPKLNDAANAGSGTVEGDPDAIFAKPDPADTASPPLNGSAQDIADAAPAANPPGLDIFALLPIEDTSPVGMCVDCMRSHCGDATSSCLSDPQCVRGLFCSLTECSLGGWADTDGGSADLACLAGCFDGELMAAVQVAGVVACPTRSCAEPCAVDTIGDLTAWVGGRELAGITAPYITDVDGERPVGTAGASATESDRAALGRPTANSGGAGGVAAGGNTSAAGGPSLDVAGAGGVVAGGNTSAAGAPSLDRGPGP